MRRLSVETNYSPFKYGYYFHLLYIIMPIAYFLAHSILEQSYKEIEFTMNMVQIEFEKSIPYLSFMSVLFFVCPCLFVHKVQPKVFIRPPTVKIDVEVQRGETRRQPAPPQPDRFFRFAHVV